MSSLTAALKTPKRVSTQKRRGQRVAKPKEKRGIRNSFPAQRKQGKDRDDFDHALDEKEPTERELERQEAWTRTNRTSNCARKCDRQVQFSPLIGKHAPPRRMLKNSIHLNKIRVKIAYHPLHTSTLSNFALCTLMRPHQST